MNLYKFLLSGMRAYELFGLAGMHRATVICAYYLTISTGAATKSPVVVVIDCTRHSLYCVRLPVDNYTFLFPFGCTTRRARTSPNDLSLLYPFSPD